MSTINIFMFSNDLIKFHEFVGKSFILLDASIVDIYMFFEYIHPFFLIKKRGTHVFIQINAFELLEILENINSDIIKGD